MGDGICPECGVQLESFVEGSSMGSSCPACGWSVATTYTLPIRKDERKYTITLLPGGDLGQETIKAVSSVANCNYLTARQLLMNAPIELFSGLAPEILERKRVLDKARVPIAISPHFPYDDEGKEHEDD